MNTLKTLSVSLLLATALLSPAVVSAKKTYVINFNETPVKTICLKHPAAADVNKFFSEITMLTFEVFKPGTKEDVANIISSLKMKMRIGYYLYYESQNYSQLKHF